MHPIYRIIHIENLPKLLEWGCDWSPNQATSQGLQKKSIHHKDIMDKRQHAAVRVPPGGVVADYVPFYFGPKSPMLYAIKQGKVEGHQGQREILYLLSHAEEVEAAKLPFAFTDGHAIISYVNHYNQLADLSKLDWNVIQAQYWNNLLDGRCRRQAEFLIKDRFPLDLLREIGVMDGAVRQKVSKLVEQTAFRPLIQMHREWYF